MSRAIHRRGVALCALVAALLCLPSAAASAAPRKPDRTNPVVAFKTPTAGASVSGALSGAACEASATDKNGVDRVEFSVDGTALNVDRAAPYNCVWDTTGSRSGQHTVTARAVDTSSNAATTNVTVSVAASEPAPDPTPAPTPTPQVTLTPVDGGADYYGGFSNPLPTSADFFPIAAWIRPADEASKLAAYKAFGMNIMHGVECPECANEDLIRASGLRTIIQADERTRFSGLGAEVAGWFVADEADMVFGPGWDGWDGTWDWNHCVPAQDQGGQCGYTVMQRMNAGLPGDGRARWANYGKGVLEWETDAQASVFVNQFQDVTSTDYYWFTDPNARSNARYGFGSSYGDDVRRVRRLDALDGKRAPVWHTIELGWPFTESAVQGARRILPPEIRSAVWHSLIAGARGIDYFDHNFGPNTPGSTILGNGYEDNRLMATAVNEQIKTLAPVLNAPFVTSGHSATDTMAGDVRSMVKWQGGHFYLFAGADRGGGDATFSIPCVGDATALRLAPSNMPAEAASIPVSGGSWTDSFADKNAVHIYRIDGGSTCGL